MPSRDLAALQPEAHVRLLAFYNAIRDGHLGVGLDAVISCTLRSREEQAALYAQGRSSPGKMLHAGGRRRDGSTCALCTPPGLGHPVTGAPPGATWHEYGYAADFLLLDRGKVTAAVDAIEDPAWQAFGHLADEMDLCWGGHWAIRDGPHVELHPAGHDCRSAAQFGREMKGT